MDRRNLENECVVWKEGQRKIKRKGSYVPYGARKSFERWKESCYRFAFKDHRSHDLGSQEEEMRFVRGTTLFLSWQIGLRTMRRIRMHGCVYSFRLDACIWKPHRCRMRHVRVHVPDLCEPRPLTSRLLGRSDFRYFDQPKIVLVFVA